MCLLVDSLVNNFFVRVIKMYRGAVYRPKIAVVTKRVENLCCFTR